MTIYFTSDTHFGHERIIELADRPFLSAEEMNAVIIKRWNETVQPSDTVFHLGDVALGKIADSLPLVSQLNGIKFLVVGNHDRLFSTNKLSHRERFAVEYEKVFDDIIPEQGTTVSLSGYVFNVSHFPYSGDSHAEQRHTSMRMVDDGVPILHGHTHSKDKVSYSERGTMQIHVGADAWNFTPASEDEVLDLFFNRP